MADWDPAVYQRFKAQRDRPALDLLLQIPSDLAPMHIWDLGCGTGEQAAVLAARHPLASVHGLDSSEAMLAVARQRSAPVDWRWDDIAAFAPETPPDLIFTNAALQWVPDHARLFPKLAADLAPGGMLACQMPVNDRGVWRDLLVETAAQATYAAALDAVARPAILAADVYYELLSAHCDVDIWSTRYLHVLDGDDAVLNWIRGSTLRPYLDRLGEAAGAFEADLAAKLRGAYPMRDDGATLLPFERLFIVARRFDA